MDEREAKQGIITEHKNYGTAMLVGIFGGLLLICPALGYLMLGRSKKALIYGCLGWGLPILMFGVLPFLGLILGFVTLIGYLCIPFSWLFGAIAFLLYPLIIFDIHKIGKGQKGILPFDD